jgi:hypothetical protein
MLALIAVTTFSQASGEVEVNFACMGYIGGS